MYSFAPHIRPGYGAQITDPRYNGHSRPSYQPAARPQTTYSQPPMNYGWNNYGYPSSASNVQVHNSSSQSVLLPHSPQAQTRNVRTESRPSPAVQPSIVPVQKSPQPTSLVPRRAQPPRAASVDPAVARQVSMPVAGDKAVGDRRAAPTSARPPVPRESDSRPLPAAPVRSEQREPAKRSDVKTTGLKYPPRAGETRAAEPPAPTASAASSRDGRRSPPPVRATTAARRTPVTPTNTPANALVPGQQQRSHAPSHAPRAQPEQENRPNLPAAQDRKPAGFPASAKKRNTPRENLENKLAQMEKIPWSSLTLLESLGSGEFGQVFRGYFRQQEVAIKQLYWDNSIQGDTVVRDLEREIESFRHLSHKRLVKFIGACLELPHLCLVTEYMPAGSLHHLLHVRKIQLPVSHGINMCLQIGDAVQYLHSQVPLVVHRDLKSLNVVLDLQLNIKICDFGLTESMERTHITKKNNGGSPRYMAPELFDDKSKITEKIDIWAMGCIFIEIFGGPLPYEGCNNLADLTRTILMERRSPHVPSKIPSALANIFRSMLDFDHKRRPTAAQTVDQLKTAKRLLVPRA